MSERSEPDGKSVLDGKKVLVTGAARGLGHTITQVLGRAGAELALHYRTSAKEAEELALHWRQQGRRTLLLQAELTAVDEVRALVDRLQDAWGGVDILVNNVGPYTDVPLLELPVEEWNRILQGNVTSAWLLSQLLIPAMRERGWGRVVNISARSAFVRDHTIYGLAKAMLNVLTESLALEAAPEVTVNAVAPGWLSFNEAPDERVQRILSATPLKRLVTAEEVAAAVFFFCSPPAAAITGEVLVMDGGRALPRSLGD